MKVLILTESLKGTAAHHLHYLLNSSSIEVVQVVYSRGLKKSKKKFLFKKIKKAFSIGPIGVINGIRMRKWFSEDVDKIMQIEKLDELCKKKEIPFASVDFTNSEENVALFASSGAQIGISLGNSFISKKVFSSLESGMINIHHEILPAYQNAQSVIWQLYHESSNTGYTIHKVSSKIDGGDILFQEEVPIVFKATLAETITQTSVALLKASAEGLVKLLENYQHYEVSAKPQQQGHSYTTPSGTQFFRILRNFKKLRKIHAGA